PAILIESVSAGGGSIASVDEGGALRVGPRSAGAEPGPACYGRGGTEPTVTDACLVLGWLDPAYPLADSVQLDRAAAERAVAGLKLPRDVCGVSAVDVLASLHRSLTDLSATELAAAYAPLLAAAASALPDAALTRFADCRFAGQGYEVTVPARDDPPALATAFRTAHRARHGYGDAD